MKGNGTPESSAVTWVDRPIWVTGLMKTGSTLLLALLDGHSRILAYPDEPSFDRLFRRRYQGASHLVKDWLYGTPNQLHFHNVIRALPSYPVGWNAQSPN